MCFPKLLLCWAIVGVSVEAKHRGHDSCRKGDSQSKTRIHGP